MRGHKKICNTNRSNRWGVVYFLDCIISRVPIMVGVGFYPAKGYQYSSSEMNDTTINQSKGISSLKVKGLSTKVAPLLHIQYSSFCFGAYSKDEKI